MERHAVTVPEVPDSRDTSETAAAVEAPLAPRRIRVLAVQIAVFVFVFYLCALLSLIVIAVQIIALAALLVIGLGFHLAGFFLAPIDAQWRLARDIAVSFNVAGLEEHTFSLTPEEAPRLWTLVRETAHRTKVAPPDRIVITMSLDARAGTIGDLSGRRHTTLCLGYDLLALLTVDQLTGIVARELAHAGHIRRGFNGWSRKVVARQANLQLALGNLIAQAQADEKSFFTAQILQALFAFVGSRIAALAARYSRQDEFAADTLAAGIVGRDLFASGLVAVALAVRMPAAHTWSDRVAEYQRRGSIVKWIRDRYITLDLGDRRQRLAEAIADCNRTPYDSHPNLHDRLLCLGLMDPPEVNGPAAVELLGDADAIAGRLIADIEQTAFEAEQAESARFARLVRKNLRRSRRTPGEWIGITLTIIGWFVFILGLIVSTATFETLHQTFDEKGVAAATGSPEFQLALVMLGVTFAFWIPGWMVTKHSAWREKRQLPAPSFALWKASLQAEARYRDWDADHVRVLAELQQLTLRGRGSAQADFWAEQAYTALGECNYQRAGLAADMCLKLMSKHVEGRIALAIAAAYLEAPCQAISELNVVAKEWGEGGSVLWALAWCHVLDNNPDLGTLYLARAVELRPYDATIWGALALCQAHIGKGLEALESVESARALTPQDPGLRDLKIQLLLEAGRARDAAAELNTTLVSASEKDDTKVLRVHAYRMMGENERAEAVMSELMRGTLPSDLVERLAFVYRTTGDPDRAAELLNLRREAGGIRPS